MAQALWSSGLNTTHIDYINAHATSTPAGDIAEIRAIQSLFGDHAYKLSISATKGSTGHLLSAAGAAEAIFSILALYEGVIPPTINLDNPDPAIDKRLDLTPNTAKRKEIRTAMSNSFGFGGTNASLIFAKI